MNKPKRIVGIIAEYNPLHNGHAYQLTYARRALHADGIIVVMSGNFTQRGTPALCAKERRARAALAAGADAVAELPVCVATSDTPLFAQGAVDVLRAMGCNALLFGSETGSLPLLQKTARAMVKPRFWELFGQNMASGQPPNTARPAALRTVLPEAGDGLYANDPNNLLGIYYLCALLRRGDTGVRPFTHKRLGQGYLEEKMPPDTQFASASAIRAAAEELRGKEPDAATLATVLGKQLRPFLPAAMATELEQAARAGELVFPRDLFRETAQACRRTPPRRWQAVCPGVPRHEILSLLDAGADWQGLRTAFHRHAPALKADRMLGWLLLGRDRPSMEEFLAGDHVGWRMLAGGLSGLEPQRGSDTLLREWEQADTLYGSALKGG